MPLNDNDRALLAQLETEPQELRNVVNDAATAARRVLQEAGHRVSFNDPHAAMDAAIYRYLRESARG